MNEAHRIQEHTYSILLPRDVKKKVKKWGTTLSHDGIVTVVRRIPEEHSAQVLSPLFADDAFFLSVYNALLSPDLIQPGRLEKRAGRIFRDSYAFYQFNFCERNQIDLCRFPKTVATQTDTLKVIIDFANKNFGTDAQTVTYFLISHEISHGPSSSLRG